jgi:hypothetical protein
MMRGALSIISFVMFRIFLAETYSPKVRLSELNADSTHTTITCAYLTIKDA